ncbi:PREDICTED: RIB43A-like with coiled-coils protein 2 [Dufourea novaeangliae]|uniref:RIB43A-like with coiled-coils protein 1 n=1 Tax=Dufourea novaeangliae TaxID=178035 RepID=A0A154P815_DUFNO|nr:PREDICTED: RIB43A-like with coiled-coils protein 2 [Dufourea novaeangliae]KZC07474.1 RIB43A-like with coiled-coils protein 1 [Dufourea novaeangliae]
MLKFQTATKEDLKLAASIQRRRQIEAERKQRIFNPRFRKIGVDKESLDKQVEEKKQQRQLEQARESQLDENLVRSSHVALLLEKQQHEERRKINLEIEDFRRHYQRTEDRRDYDLYDPQALKKSLPIRLGDDDPRFGLGCAQKFEGEMGESKERLRAQKEERRYWIEKQKEERVQAERDCQEAEKAYQEAVISRDKRAMALDQMERECRRRLNEATARFNRALADEQERRRHCEALLDEEDKKAEIYNHVTGDFLTEAKEQAESTRGPLKPLASRYKGMNPDELKAFRDGQARQMEEIEKMKLEEKRMNEEWDRLMNSHAIIADSYQREMDQKRAETNKKIAEENLQLAEEHKSHQEYLNRVLYKNKPTAAFFEQFNKDAR